MRFLCITGVCVPFRREQGWCRRIRGPRPRAGAAWPPRVTSSRSLGLLGEMETLKWWQRGCWSNWEGSLRTGFSASAPLTLGRIILCGGGRPGPRRGLAAPVLLPTTYRQHLLPQLRKPKMSPDINNCPLEARLKLPHLRTTVIEPSTLKKHE